MHDHLVVEGEDIGELDHAHDQDDDAEEVEGGDEDILEPLLPLDEHKEVDEGENERGCIDGDQAVDLDGEVIYLRHCRYLILLLFQ